MSKKSKREPITTSKPQPAICSCKQGKICEEIKALNIKLEEANNRAEQNRRLKITLVQQQIEDACKISDLCIAKRKFETELTAAKEELHYYRHAFNVMRIINIIFTVGFAVMTAILIWR